MVRMGFIKSHNKLTLKLPSFFFSSACTAYTITNVLHSTPSFTATPANSLTTSLMLDRDSTESVQASLKQQCQNAYSTLEYYILYEIDTNLNGRDNQAGVFAENVAVPVYYSTKTVPGTRYGKIATATKSGVYTSYSFYTHGTPTIHVTEEVGGTAIECGYTLSLKSSSARVTVPAMELGYTQVTICEPTLSIGQLSD